MSPRWGRYAALVKHRDTRRDDTGERMAVPSILLHTPESPPGNRRGSSTGSVADPWFRSTIRLGCEAPPIQQHDPLPVHPYQISVGEGSQCASDHLPHGAQPGGNLRLC